MYQYGQAKSFTSKYEAVHIVSLTIKANKTEFHLNQRQPSVLLDAFERDLWLVCVRSIMHAFMYHVRY